jgi:uncharacterized protein YbgA (DUF1722 family)/uncharacterized protein YbbK (DUF523 family)
MGESEPSPIRIGISSCLLGTEVRFDGGHKRDAYICGTLSRYFTFVPVCPEVAVGLGMPREPMRLVRHESGTRVNGVKTPSLDVTEPLGAYGRHIARTRRFSGYIFKRASPSCGMFRVKVYKPTGELTGQGRGAYAEALLAEQPLLPAEEEGRLGDPGLRENFIGRVFVYHRWQQLIEGGITPRALVEFHSEHKFLVLAHNQAAYRRMGRLVAEAGSAPLGELADQYVLELMTALRRVASPKQHVNVLQHLFGFVSKALDAGDREEVVAAIEQYRQGWVPLVVPITLLNHHFRRHPNPYVARQHYLHPHPRELALRNLL